MEKITITEALAEIKTIDKRIASKQNFINQFLARQDGVRDPLEKNGGSVKAIQAERQSIGDLELRIISLRRGIQKANDETTVTINGMSMTISEWLTWRREIVSKRLTWLKGVRTQINNIRDNAKRQGNALVSASSSSDTVQPTDIVVNVDEMELSQEIENLEDILGQLDGQLSLKNATVLIG